MERTPQLVVLALILVVSGCHSPSRQSEDDALGGRGEAGWTRLTAELDVRLCVNRPLLAEDQCWYTWIEIRNRSQTPILVGGDAGQAFTPRLVEATSREPVPSHGSYVGGDGVGGWCEPNGHLSGAPSHDDCSSVPFNYSYGGRTWRVRPGDYLLGGSFHCKWRKTEDMLPQVAHVDLHPVHVGIWASLSDEELRERISQIRAECRADPDSAWPVLVRLVKPGMTRGQAEIILPRDMMTPWSATVSGGASVERYWVAPHWEVTIPYDHTGVRRDSSGMALSHSPQNRVLAPPSLSRKDMPKPIQPMRSN